MPNVQGVSHFHLLHCHLTPELSPSPAVHAGPTTVLPGPGQWAGGVQQPAPLCFMWFTSLSNDRFCLYLLHVIKVKKEKAQT